MRVTAQQKQEQTGLIPVESVDALALFTGGKLTDLLAQIEAEVADAPTDTSTDRGRKEIASTAYKVARSKTVIDDAGKKLVAEWKAKSADVDASRRQAREFLDALKERVRKPLTKWEAEQARIAEEKRLAAEAEARRIEEEKEAALRERERQIAEREAALARLEAERKERERLEREAAERKEREERIAREAEERAKQQAEAALQRERLAREQAEQREKEAAEQAELERLAAEERAQKQAEEAAELARQQAAREAQEREDARRAAEEQKRQEAAARAADKANRDKVNAAIVAAFTAVGIGQKTADTVIRLVAAGSIPHMHIRF